MILSGLSWPLRARTTLDYVSLRDLPAHGTLALLDYDEYCSREIQLELHFAQTNYVGVFHSDGVTLTTLPNMAGLHDRPTSKERT
jgi:hypothetical protein